MPKTFSLKVSRVVEIVTWIDVTASNEDEAWALVEEGLDDGVYEKDFDGSDDQEITYQIHHMMPE